MSEIRPEPLPELLERLCASPEALLALAIPRCPACELLPATLAAVARSRPRLAVGIAILATPDDWSARERLLWPRGIRVSRASVPALTILRDGQAVARRDGSAPARDLDRWLEEFLGPADVPIVEQMTPEERDALARTGARRAQHHIVRGGGGAPGGAVEPPGL
jgi:hypothetical protein